MRFFFNLAGAVYDPDQEGHELDTMAEARIEGARLAGEMIRDQPGLAWAGDELRVEVTDSNQILLCTVIVLGVDSAIGKGLA
jgi:hypothetical protein